MAVMWSYEKLPDTIFYTSTHFHSIDRTGVNIANEEVCRDKDERGWTTLKSIYDRVMTQVHITLLFDVLKKLMSCGFKINKLDRYKHENTCTWQRKCDGITKMMKGEQLIKCWWHSCDDCACHIVA